MEPIDPGYHRKNEKNPPSGSGNMSDYKNSKISTRQDQHLRMCVNCTREIRLVDFRSWQCFVHVMFCSTRF